ncbi:hypothetical protein CYMTET_53681 [Cymbomonas tetramitiformis]|uniref:Uncharacterized protein n=1 Tax=Cymbomonas tetramitiformis TaxID=36881 RepID=A0AAE0BHL5_9CHLO|nr:hypothetical protein CYMTET_53681 [Cymbomonas tetramitiformis]
MLSLSSGGKPPVTAIVWTDRAMDSSSETYSPRRVELRSEDMVAAMARATTMTQSHRSRISVRAVNVTGKKPSKLREFGVGLEELSRAVRAALRVGSIGTSSDSDRSSQSSGSEGDSPEFSPSTVEVLKEESGLSSNSVPASSPKARSPSPTKRSAQEESERQVPVKRVS